MRKKGYIAEEKAINYLIDNGFKIVDKNYYSKFGEIDIIALKDEILHFIEVKSGENFEPIYAITSKKLQKIILTVDYFLMKKNINLPYQIDAVIIKKDKIELIENITIF